MTLLNETYEDMRQSIVNNWDKINFYNDVGELVLAHSIPHQTRIRWTHKTGSETVVTGYDLQGKPITSNLTVQNNPDMALRVLVNGSELSELPCTLTTIEVVSSKTNRNEKVRLRETLDEPVPFAVSSDSLTYTLNLKVGE